MPRTTNDSFPPRLAPPQDSVNGITFSAGAPPCSPQICTEDPSDANRPVFPLTISVFFRPQSTGFWGTSVFSLSDVDPSRTDCSYDMTCGPQISLIQSIAGEPFYLHYTNAAGSLVTLPTGALDVDVWRRYTIVIDSSFRMATWATDPDSGVTAEVYYTDVSSMGDPGRWTQWRFRRLGTTALNYFAPFIGQASATRSRESRLIPSCDAEQIGSLQQLRRLMHLRPS